MYIPPMEFTTLSLKLPSESAEHLQKLVFDNLRKIENVRSTLTLIVSEDNTIRHKTVENRHDVRD